jgi:leucyl-tRNA synthetase
VWNRPGRSRLPKAPWPKADPALLERQTFELVIQGAGKVRDRVEMPEATEEELVAMAKASERVRAQLHGKQIRQTIVVPRKLVNLVVG